MGDEENKLIEAIEQIRRDKHQPWRYILFTFLNGMAQGLGVALGATIFLGIIIEMGFYSAVPFSRCAASIMGPGLTLRRT